MTQSERISLLKKEIPDMKDEIIERSQNTVRGQNYVYVSDALTIAVTDVESHYFRAPVITFPSGPISEKAFQDRVGEEIRQEMQYS